MEGHVEWTMAAPLWQFTGDPQDPLDRSAVSHAHHSAFCHRLVHG